ncbi:MAG: glutaredoxin-like protein [Acidobacteria bacterium ADurb.Bin340]|mgnify:CR=1 FL=1|nr:MAG: glutaredoxin-like protein [Acidobacteria bacterium ADurb.Bin340]HOD33549.1 glutaredoxin family protein [Holophaga sp.]HQL47652.1 glutaredoxin family protein [Holophaga sp.]
MPDPQELRDLDLQIFSARWCSDCRRLDRWLEAQGLAFPVVDLEAQPEAAQRLEQETGKRAIPFVLVKGRRWVPGYHKDLPTRFDPDRFVLEVLAAAAD